MDVSTALLDEMGFRDGQEVEATFHSVNVYSLSGIHFEFTMLERAEGKTPAGTNYRFAVGYSVNEACRKLLGDVLVEDELKWAEERACRGPYLLVCTQVNSARHTGRVKRDGRSITTYGMFTDERATLAELDRDVLPCVVTAASKLLHINANSSIARHVTREVFGLTADLEPVDDYIFTLSSFGSTSLALKPDVLRIAVNEVVDFARLLDPKVSRFLRLAADEPDPLKRFLFFFLSIEVETQKTFAGIDHAKRVGDVLDRSRSNCALTVEFLQSEPERLKNLKDRFMWCAIFAWRGMTSADVDQFAQLKKVRDKLSHGDIAEPPPDAVVAVESLAIKLQTFRIPKDTFLSIASARLAQNGGLNFLTGSALQD